MDYKELSEELRALSKHVPEQMCGEDVKGPLERAADAIENLMAERDALLLEIKGNCYFCAFETGACVACDNGEDWQWRGQQKEGGA